MENSCQKGIINCCYCNCLESLYVTISELITSILGIIINSIAYSFINKIKDKFDSIISLNYINITYFGSSSIIATIILVLRKLNKIEQSVGYKFGSYSTQIYSYISKIMAIINIIGFLYLMAFTSWIAIHPSREEVESILHVTYLGIHGEINLITGTEGVELNCDNMDCYDDEKKDEINNIKYIDFFIFIFSIFLSFFLMFFNGASYASEKQRISKLIKGKLQIEFMPVESTDLCNKKFCNMLNSIICYRMTVIQILNYIKVLSVVVFIFSIFIMIIAIKAPWPQAIFYQSNMGVPMGIVLSVITFISTVYCRGVETCDFNAPPNKRKCFILMILILTILFFPMEILGFFSCFCSQLGASKVIITCSYEEPCDDLFFINDKYFREKYSFYLTVKQASIKYIILGFILGIVPPICYFFLIVLMIGYIIRSISEYNTLNKIYDTRMISIEENGAMVDLDLFEIVTETVKIQKTRDNNEANGQEIIVYSRKIKSNIVQNP